MKQRLIYLDIIWLVWNPYILVLGNGSATGLRFFQKYIFKNIPVKNNNN